MPEGPSKPSRRAAAVAELRGLVRAVREEEVQIEELIARASRSRPWLRVLTFVVGALAMLLAGVRLLFVNWRLLLIEVLPAAWIWIAMLDLKLHVLRGHSFKPLDGALVAVIMLAIVAVTAACYFLNAVFALAISRPQVDVRAAYDQARANPRPALAVGTVIGAMLAFSSMITWRWDKPWFAVSMGITIGLMMITYVAVPARIIGVRSEGPRRDRLAASALSTAVGATVTTPPYLLGRVGILMLGSKPLRIPGILLLVVGSLLQMGANGAVRAVKLGAVLTAARPSEPSSSPGEDDAAADHEDAEHARSR
jgi:hypothetical protein